MDMKVMISDLNLNVGKEKINTEVVDFGAVRRK